MSFSSESPCIKNFQETKDGYVIPVVETSVVSETPEDNSNGFEDTLQKKRKGQTLFVDINLGDDRIGQIECSPNDNIFHLAEQFVRVFQLDGSYIQYIAFLIRTAMRNHEKKNGHISQYSTNKRSCQRTPIAKLKVDVGKGKSGTILIREGDNPTTLARNFAKVFQLKPSQTENIAREIKQQLYNFYTKDVIVVPENIDQCKSSTSIELSDLGNTSPKKITIQDSNSIRDSDFQSVPIIATNLSKEPAFKSSNIESLHHHYNYNQNHLSSPSRKNSESIPLDTPKLLFNLEIEIDDNTIETLQIFEDSHPEQLSASFANKFAISKEAQHKLCSIIKKQIDGYNQS